MHRYLKKALLRSAFFIAWSLLPTAAQADPEQCPDLPESGQGIIKFIYDGDTVQLTDGRKIRLLGIDTPEINHRRGHAEPFARTALKRLQELIPRGTRVILQTDRELHDRYQRLLAHLRRADGLNPALTLLDEGLATLLVIPPNSAAATCFAAAERRARNASKGLWDLPRYQPVPASQLSRSANADGFHVASGQVTRISASRRFHYLYFGNHLAVRISKHEWQQYFVAPFGPLWPGAKFPRQLLNQNVVLRGYLRPGRTPQQTPPHTSWQLRLRHPAGLEWQP